MRRSGIKLEAFVFGLVLLLIAAFAYISSSGHHDWSGSDSQAEKVVTDLTGGSYVPWYQSVYTPPSGEIESLFFALQAATGSLIVGYFLGYYRAMAKMKACQSRAEPEGKQQDA